MFHKDEAFKKQYTIQMQEIKDINRQKIIHDYRTRLNLYLSTQHRLEQPIDSGVIDIEIDNTEKNPIAENLPVNYFSDKKIAVYTAIFGACDEIVEPVTVPDNCEFFIFTDQAIPEDSVWQPVTVDAAAYGLEDKTNVMRNRFFKMQPHLFFEEFEYSMYVDGNIKIMTDPTEFIDRMNEYGILLHNHYRVKCAYVETDRCRIQGLISDEESDKQKAHLEAEGLPRNYGFLECPVIFRDHHNETSQEIMTEWWTEFQENASRDQINLPLVLYRRGIRMLELAGLGNDLYSDYAFQKTNHRLSHEDSVIYNGEVLT